MAEQLEIPCFQHWAYQCRRSGVFIVNFEHISNLVLQVLLFWCSIVNCEQANASWVDKKTTNLKIKVLININLQAQLLEKLFKNNRKISIFFVPLSCYFHTLKFMITVETDKRISIIPFTEIRTFPCLFQMFQVGPTE